jgi:hypothetical protein
VFTMSCATSTPPGYEQLPAAPGDAADVMQKLRSARADRGLNIAFFGHSLLRRLDGPAIDIPATLAALHESARGVGRTALPLGTHRMHYEGPNNLGYWFQGAGQARQKLKTEDPGWDVVVGVGFMHMVPATQRQSWLYQLGHRLKPGANDMGFMNYPAYTPHKYLGMQAVRAHAPGALWVNYVGPRTSDAPLEQPYVDQRFECIRESAFRAGVSSLNVPVGRAFRVAEARAAKQPELGLKLQVADHLHLTRAGEYLAANVFYAMLYEVDVVGLPLPASHQGQVVGDVKLEARAVTLLQESARDTVREYLTGKRVRCTPDAMLSEDADGERLLRAGR